MKKIRVDMKRLFSHGKFNWYGVHRALRRGVDIALKPTLKCNLGCSYCGAEMPGSACWVNPGTELQVWEWVQLVYNYNKKTAIRQVGITGGEPGLYAGLWMLVDALVAAGYVIYIYTNLVNMNEFKKITPSNKVKFRATLHENVDRGLFEKNLSWLSERFFVVNQELDPTWEYGNDIESMYRKTKYASEQNHLEVDLFGPDGKLYSNDEKPNKAKYDVLRKEWKGRVANPYREQLINL